MSDVPNFVYQSNRAEFISKLKRMMFWYFKEQSLISIPIVFIHITVWNVFSRFFQKEKMLKNKIGFTALNYHGNSKAVFNWMRKNTNYECFWIARSRKAYNDVKKDNGKVVYAYSFNGLNYMKDMKVLVISDSVLSMLFPNKKPKIVQLWHGVGFKGRSSFDECITLWCEATDFTKNKRVENFNFPNDKIIPTGLARLDTLYNCLNDPDFNKIYRKKLNLPLNKKILLYAPTWEIGLFPWGEEYSSFRKLCKFCQDNNIAMVFRPHPLIRYNKRKMKQIIKNHKDIFIFDVKKLPNVMELMSISDFLITDVSSIGIDFLVTGKPIIYLDVLNEYFYQAGAGMMVPLEYMVGEKAKNEEELYNALKFVLEKGNRYKEKHKEILKLIHGDVKGDNSENVAKVIISLLDH